MISPNKKIINENQQPNYELVGEIKNSDVDYAHGDFYVLVNKNFLNSKDVKEINDNMLISKTIDGSEDSYYRNYFTDKNKLRKILILNPKYKNTFIEYSLLGLPTDEKIKECIKMFSLMRKNGNKIILTHNSNKKITDGFIRIGMPMNAYSKSDFALSSTPRAYFWATSYGKDVSNNSEFEYQTELDKDEIYCYQINPDNFRNFDQILDAGYKAVSYYMGGEAKNGIVVASFISLPIKSIRVRSDYSKIYNSNWELIN